MYEDMRRIKESDSIFVKSDKSGNLYEIEKQKYNQMMFKEVVKKKRRVGIRLPDDPLKWNFSRRFPTRDLSSFYNWLHSCWALL